MLVEPVEQFHQLYNYPIVLWHVLFYSMYKRSSIQCWLQLFRPVDFFLFWAKPKEHLHLKTKWEYIQCFSVLTLKSILKKIHHLFDYQIESHYFLVLPQRQWLFFDQIVWLDFLRISSKLKWERLCQCISSLYTSYKRLI